MSKKKAFDCIEYKRAIQAKHAAETAGLSVDEEIKRRQEWLATSDNPAAQLWRKMKEAQAASSAAKER